MIPIRAMPLRHAGRYEIVVRANGDELDRQYFDVEAFDVEEG